MRHVTASVCAVILMGLVLLPGGCPVSDGGVGTGTLRVLVTDKPFPFDLIASARITITRVDVRLGDAGDETGDDDDDDADRADSLDDADDAGATDAGAVDESDDSGDDGDDTDDLEEADDAANTDADEADEFDGLGDDEGGDSDDDDADDGDDSEDDDHGSGDGFLTIFEGEKEFDLLGLQNGRADLLADVEVPAGTYTQMRLVVTQGTVELKNGRPPFVLTVPSGEQSGIKLQFTFTVEEGAETTLLLDVDLSRAFRPVPAGRIEDPDTIREFKFQPAFAMRLVNLLEAGSVSGAVTDEAGTPLADVSVTAFDADEEVTSTSTEDDGTYVLAGLPVGEYRLEFSAASYQDAEVEGVEVTVGEETPSGEVALAAE